METNKEQQHTPEPWIPKDASKRDIIGTHLVRINRLGNAWEYTLSIPDFERACKCVNAMEGIEDPEKFVKIALDIKTNPKRFIDNSPPGRQKMWLRMIEQHEDLRKYKTACEGINPDNPMAVAENLKELYEKFKAITESEEALRFIKYRLK